MTTYFLFSCPHYYPAGGAFDHIGCYDSLEDAKDATKDIDFRYNWAHIAIVNDEGYLTIICDRTDVDGGWREGSWRDRK